ncbi:4-hydroxy-tetrahydrodipicolinate reductase [Ignavibacteria bacterium]|nr:4-hydroxy-tetrahydrodipicolinate reductase [Bacteroidota bacterium]MCZ2133719.1 4-hydroxy-tetrahydrodipicolinate reductase [Bacteroidota bacterium]
MKIALIGCGSTGKEIIETANVRNDEIVRVFTSGMPVTPYNRVEADVFIDFSTSAAVLHNVQTAAVLGVPIVIGTTGWHNKAAEVRKIIEDSGIGCVYGSNFSLGANLMFSIARYAASLAQAVGGYDAGIYEAHHKGKADSPSGTALTLAESIMKELSWKKEIVAGNLGRAVQQQELHIGSLRVGSIFGQHSAIFDADSDTLEITHTAKNRKGFALGALQAAEWITNKKGMYNFSEYFLTIIGNQT